MRFTSLPIPAVSNIPAKQVEFYASKSESDTRIESLRSFQLGFIDEFAVPGKRFNPAAFEAKVNEGEAKFQRAVADEKFTARRPVLNGLAAQFQADAAHLQAKPGAVKSLPHWQVR